MHPLLIVLIVVIFLVASHFVAIYIIFLRFYKRISLKKIDQVFDKNPKYQDYKDIVYPAKEKLLNLEHKEIDIKSLDGLRLHGYYYDLTRKKAVIFFHGAHSDPFIIFGIQALYLLEHGYNVLIVDLRAHNKSEGRFLSYGKHESIDVKSWIKYAKEELKLEEISIYGASMGGAAIALASPQLDTDFVKNMVIDCSYTSTAKLVDHLIASQHIPSFIFLGGVKFLAKHLVKAGFNEFYTPDYLKNNKVPTLFVQGSADTIATNEFLMDNYNDCASYKALLVIEGAEHTMAFAKGGEEALQSLYKFLEKKD